MNDRKDHDSEFTGESCFRRHATLRPSRSSKTNRNMESYSYYSMQGILFLRCEVTSSRSRAAVAGRVLLSILRTEVHNTLRATFFLNAPGMHSFWYKNHTLHKKVKANHEQKACYSACKQRPSFAKIRPQSLANFISVRCCLS